MAELKQLECVYTQSDFEDFLRKNATDVLQSYNQYFCGYRVYTESYIKYLLRHYASTLFDEDFAVANNFLMIFDSIECVEINGDRTFYLW